MTVSITPALILAATRGTLHCPIYLALEACGYAVGFVNVGMDKHDRLIGNVYHMRGDEAMIQPLPTAVTETIRAYDKTGQMEPFEFELPDL